MNPTSLLVKLEKLRNQHDAASAEVKYSTLLELSTRRFKNSDEIERYHNVLLFMRAYPNNQALLNLLEEILRLFAHRIDVKRFREELASSGIAGCPIDYRFFYPMADWLATNWGESLQIDWSELDLDG